MSLTQALARQFSPATRYKGDAYAAHGSVTIVGGDDTHVDAVVQGTDDYRVRIRRDPEGARTRFGLACSCPFVETYVEPCKHLWATLKVADRAGYLDGGGAQVTPRTAEIRIESLEGDGHFAGAGPPAVKTNSGGVDPPAPVEAPAEVQNRNAFLVNVHRRLGDRSQQAPAAYRFGNGELLFVIDAPGTIAGPGVLLETQSRRRTQAGDWTRPQPAAVIAADLAVAPAWDRRILAPLLGAGRLEPDSGWTAWRDETRHSRFRLPAALTLELLPVIARSGRGYLRTGKGSSDLYPITWDDGGAWRFRLLVTSRPEGFEIWGRFERGDDSMEITEPVVVSPDGFLITRQRIARWEPGSDAPFLDELRLSGKTVVPWSDRALLAQSFAEAGVETNDLPDALRITVVDITPQPRLRIAKPPDGDPHDRLRAVVSFDYDGIVTVAAREDAAPLFDAAGLRLIPRVPAEEDRRFKQLLSRGFGASWNSLRARTEFDIRSRQLAAAVRSLVTDGWFVEGDAGVYRAAGAVRMSVSTGIDWFDLESTVEFGTASVPLTEILAAMRRGDRLIRLGDGEVGLLPEDWLRRYLPLATVGQIDGTTIRFRGPQAALLDAMLADRAAQASIVVDEAFARVRQQLAAFSAVTALDPPGTFAGTLRPYQREALGWLAFLRRFGFGGCLADDMGLGKTVVVLALLASRVARMEAGGDDDAAGRNDPARPSLVVVPRSLVANWLSEAARFVPGLRVLDASHATRAESLSQLAEYDAVVVTYGTLRRDIETLKDVRFDYVILDEAQTIKNATTSSSKAARLLIGRHRLALSGTPIENHLGELWSLFEFLNPGILGASSVFNRVTASGPEPDAETTSLLARGLRPFILRRTKGQVARDLPARTEQTIICELSARERALYDSLRRHYRNTLLTRVADFGMGRSRMQVLEALLRLRQVACHAGLVDAKHQHALSAKFEALLPQLREVLAEGHKALVFSQFTTLLGLLRPWLDAERIGYEYLDGRTRDCAARVKRFQEDPQAGLFLISLKAGGLGLNLTAAEEFFLLDPWWNPAVEAQAIDRAHRIGQTREVFAYRLITKDTIEEKVLALQQSKRALADAVLTADAVGLRHLSREDLEWLLT